MVDTWIVYRLISVNMKIEDKFPLKILIAFVVIYIFTIIERNLHYMKNYTKHLLCFDVYILEF